MGTAMHNITMPPRLNLYGASRSLAFRSRPSIISYQSRISPAVSRRAFADAADSTSFANLLALGQLQNVATGGHATDPVNLGHKFGLPDLPLPSDGNLKYRYDPVVSQVTTLLMKHGKLSVAQRVGPSVSLFSFCGHLLRRTKDLIFLCKC